MMRFVVSAAFIALVAPSVLLGQTASATDTLTVASAAKNAMPSTTDSSVTDTTPGLARRILQRTLGVSGSMSLVSELYGVQGIEARRPGQAWRAQLSPQVRILDDITVTLNALLSSEGSDVRQDVSQIGISPDWGWGTAHLGDFSQNFTPYTLQGVRIRGAGLDLRPGRFRFGAQAGRSQRTITSGTEGPVYRRNLGALTTGYGDRGSSFIDVTLLRAKDDISSLSNVVVIDTVLIDTLPEFDRPRVETRPQENTVLGAAGQLALMQSALVLRGEVAGAVLTNDLASPRVETPKALLDMADPIHPIRLSTSSDYAWNMDGSLSLRRFGIQAGYEYIGPGYASLGLPYLIGDRQAYRLGGSTRFLQGRVNVQGQYQHQNDNLLDQKRTTTNRNVFTGSLAWSPINALTTTLSGVYNTIGNDSPVDTFLVDNKTTSVNANASLQRKVIGRQTSFSLNYGVQLSEEGNSFLNVPDVAVHNITTSVQYSITPRASVSPSLSVALKQVGEGERERDVFAGFRGQARLLDGRLSTGANLTRTFSQGRKVFSFTSNAGYDFPLGVRLNFNARYTSYSAFASRPAFREEYVTTSLSRSF